MRGAVKLNGVVPTLPLTLSTSAVRPCPGPTVSSSHECAAQSAAVSSTMNAPATDVVADSAVTSRRPAASATPSASRRARSRSRGAPHAPKFSPYSITPTTPFVGTSLELAPSSSVRRRAPLPSSSPPSSSALSE